MEPEAWMKELANWKAATLIGDFAKIMASISDNFSHSGYDYEAESKVALKEFMNGMIAEGNLEDADIEINGAGSIVYPIDFANNYGAVTIELTLTKEGKACMVTDMRIEGL